MSSLIILDAMIGKEQTERLEGWILSCTCTYYVIYSNYAKNAICIKYVPELTLVMVDGSRCHCVKTLVMTAGGLLLWLTLFGTCSLLRAEWFSSTCANTSLVEREMWATYIQTMHNMQNMQNMQNIQTMQNMSMVHTNNHLVYKLHFTFFACSAFETHVGWGAPGAATGEGKKNGENTKNARDAKMIITPIACIRVTHNTVVSLVEHQIGLDRRAAISSLRCSDEQGVSALQGLR